MKKVFDAVVSVGEYEDKQTGKKKQQYRNVGAVLQNDDGRMSLKLDLLPATGFNGWINFFEPKPREQAGKPAANAAAPYDDSDVPW